MFIVSAHKIADGCMMLMDSEYEKGNGIFIKPPNILVPPFTLTINEESCEQSTSKHLKYLQREN